MSTIRDPAYITDAGRTMMTAGGDVTYTKAVLYDQDISHLTSDQIKALTTIGSPLREVKVGISDKQNTDRGTTVILEATFQNDNLANDLPYTAVGFFAQKGSDEKLIAVAVANTGAYLAATSPDGVATDALDLKLAIAIGDATNVTATVDPAGSVTPATLNGAINKATHDLTAQFATKADKTTVEQELTTKANASDVYTKKQVDDALSSRDTAIATKADKATVDAEISKIDFTPYAKTANVNKQIKTVTDLVNSKVSADYSYSKAELDKKLLAVTTDTSGKVNATQVASMIADKADKTYVDNQIASIDFSKIKFHKQYVNSDGQTADKTWSATKNKDGTYTIDLWQDDWTASKLAYVLVQLPNKADTSTVNAQIADAKNTAQSNLDKVKSDLNGAINTKANSDDVYNKPTIDSAFNTRDNNINRAQSTADGAQTTANNALPKVGGNMALRSTINWNGGGIDDRTGNLGGLNWAGGTDYAKIYGDQDGNDKLDLAFDLGDDGSNHFSFRRNGSETSAITNDGHYTGTVDWGHVNGRPQDQIDKINTDNPLFRMIANSNTWNDIFGVDNDSNVLTSLRINSGGSGVLLNDCAAGIGFGGVDTKGVLSVAYQNHQARITGGNGAGPAWSEDVAWKSDINDLSNKIRQLIENQFEVQTFTDATAAANWEAQRPGKRMAIVNK